MEKIVEISELTKEYYMGEVTVHALRGISFDLMEGEFVTILGPSGSGKSTILNILGGIDDPTSGVILYRGRDITRISEKERTVYRRKAIGFVFQFYNLIPSLTARENILLASDLSESPISAEELLEKTGLGDRANHFPSQLSGGQQQRVAIARAIAKNPDILLCDEPTGSLDIQTGIQVLDILRNFNREYGKTVVIITHNAGISQIADRVFHIKDGFLEKTEQNLQPSAVEEVLW